MNFQRVSSVSGSDDGIVVLASELRMMLKARPDPESKSRRESLVTSTCVKVSHAVRGEGTRCRNSSTVRAAGDLAAEIRGALSRNGRRYFTSACHAGHAASGKHLVKRNYGEEFCFPPKDSAPLQSIHPRRRWQAGMLKHCSTAHEMDKQASRIRRVRRLWRRSTFKQSLARKSFANKTCASSHGLDRKFSDHSSASTSAQANGMGKMTTEGNIANDSLLNVYIQQSRLHLQSEPDPEPTVQAIEPQLKCQMQMCIEGHVILFPCSAMRSCQDGRHILFFVWVAEQQRLNRLHVRAAILLRAYCEMPCNYQQSCARLPKLLYVHQTGGAQRRSSSVMCTTLHLCYRCLRSLTLPLPTEIKHLWGQSRSARIHCGVACTLMASEWAHLLQGCPRW